jgi:prepilin-type N-terminal cleavage/methylation domain-containing protein
MKFKFSNSGFSLVEVLIVLLLLSGAFIILLQALNTGKFMNAKAEVLTQQAVLLNNTIQEIRSRRFDENTTAPWSSSLGLDNSTNAHLSFDGANDYVNLPDFSYLNDFSFSAWFKIDSRNYWERIFDFGKGGQGDIFLTTMGGRTQGNLELTIHPFGGTYTINPGVTCDDGQWHHVVFTYDKGGTGMVLYIDGENKGSNSYNTHSFSDFGGGQNFYLGKANWNDPYYDGKMEQVGLYDIALSADAVAEIYGGGNNFNLNTNTGNYNSEANLIGYWIMDEGTEFSAIDHSGNGNNGTINGASWQTIQSSSENSILTWDDIDDFNQYSISEIPNYPAFGCAIKVDYVEASSGFHSAISGPSDYKRVMVEINHKTLPALRDTFIVSPGL